MMGVEVSNSVKVPALDYKYFFMESMQILQSKIYGSGVIPKFSLRITYRMYAIDENHYWHYANKINTIDISDYMGLALFKAQFADTDLLDTMVVIEHAVAKIVEDTTDLGETNVI